MPPPNITGKLHLGHSLFLTLQDILARYHRSCGENTLWLPGTDHAGLATDSKIREFFQKINYTPTKAEYLEKAYSWKDNFHNQITTQIRAMGASCDWARERFTLDSQYLKSSTAALKLCHEAGMLYQEDGQWYLDMTNLATELLIALKAGDITIEPTSETNTLIHFLENIEPWSISRQIWWGQQIPIFSSIDGRYWIANTLEEAQSISGLSDLTQCPDTLDTWFLSSLWPFAALGWPENTTEYQTFYPANIIETADDILFFWCARMLMMGKLCTDKWAFKKIYLHGIIRDKAGKKMSKSLGNGIDPLGIIGQYGCDALRWTLATHSTPGRDSTLALEDFKAASQFTNKLWQAGRFIQKHWDNCQESPRELINQATIWKPLTEFEGKYHRYLEREQFLQCATDLQYLFKHGFCDTWIETNKEKLHGGDYATAHIGLETYKRFLLLFHPFIPFITEELYSHFTNDLLITMKF